MKFDSMYSYDIGNTPIIKIPNMNIFIKMEKENINGSIKDRTAYYLIKNYLEENNISSTITIIESTSGNLGISLHYFSNIFNFNFLALIDKTIVKSKLEIFKKNKIPFIKVSKKGYSNYRDARVALAKKLSKDDGFIWFDQYNNMSNHQAHYETTGPELWQQMDGEIDIVVVAMGTGGTISGLSKYLKEKNTELVIYGVEPIGSTIFGGNEGDYINVGVGYKGECSLISNCKSLISRAFKVSDADAISITKEYENIGFGVSTGYSLFVAKKLSQKYPKKNIIIVSADGIDNYRGLLDETV